MDCHPEYTREQYWKTSRLSPSHDTLYTAISRDQFKQTNRFFHVWKDPKPITPVTRTKSATTTARPNEKVNEIACYLSERFQRYWIPHRDVAVDEYIEGFTGRSKDTLIIRSKPNPEGYKIWIIADRGYVIGFL